MGHFKAHAELSPIILPRVKAAAGADMSILHQIILSNLLGHDVKQLY